MLKLATNVDDCGVYDVQLPVTTGPDRALFSGAGLTTRLMAAILSLLVMAGLSRPAMAEDLAPTSTYSLTDSRSVWDWSVGAFVGRWTGSRLPLMPYNTVTGNLTFDNAGIFSVIVSKHLLDFNVPVPGTRYSFDGFTLEAEGTLNQHFGKESSTEATAALVLRTGQVPISDFGGLNFAWANGFSYSFQSPEYEFGPEGKRGVNSRHFQYYMAFETEFVPAANENLGIFMRLHHRSGIYGLISPQKTGSNYLGGGMRLRF